MDLPAYLEPFRFLTRPFPEVALTEAISRRAESIPHLLDVLERLPQRWAAGEVFADEMLHEFAAHMLAEFREPQAYRAMIRIARIPEVSEIFGDCVAECLQKMLAAVWDGDWEPLCELISDPLADEYARAAGISAIGVLFQQGRLERTELRTLLGWIYDSCLERAPVFPWNIWVATVADFQVEEELEHVRILFAEGLADPGFDPLDSVEKRLLGSRDCDLRVYSPYTNVLEEMGWWYCFSAAAAKDEIAEQSSQFKPAAAKAPPQLMALLDQRANSIEPSDHTALPHGLEGTKIGRNDSCPCGSGKKYKKCCWK